MRAFRAWLRSFRCAHEWEPFTIGGGDYWSDDGHIHFIVGRRTINLCAKCGRQRHVPFGLLFVPPETP